MDSDRHHFDHVAHLRLYPDIGKAIAEEREVSSRRHYDRHCRKANHFDGDFYLRFYAAAQQEISAGLAVTPLHHYVKFGRVPGLLSTAKAPRPTDVTLRGSLP